MPPMAFSLTIKTVMDSIIEGPICVWQHIHRIILTAEGTNQSPCLALSALLLINEECDGPPESALTENVSISGDSTPKSTPLARTIKLLSNTIRNSPG